MVYVRSDYVSMHNDRTEALTVHSGQLNKGGGEKTVPIDRNECKNCYFL